MSAGTATGAASAARIDSPGRRALRKLLRRQAAVFASELASGLAMELATVEGPAEGLKDIGSGLRGRRPPRH